METTQTTHEANRWTPLTDAVTQARELRGRAERLVEDTAATLRAQSEAALHAAQTRSEATVKRVRENLADAQRVALAQADQLSRLPELLRKQIAVLDQTWTTAIERTAQRLQIATHSDLDGLTRKVATLERKLSELTRSTQAA